MHKFKSKYEAEVASNMDKAGIEFEYETVKLDYLLNYYPDFKIKTKSGKEIIIETKGKFDAADRTKMSRVKERNPDLDIRLLFMRASEKLRKGSKTSYAMWAEKNGFKYGNGTHVPREWVDE
jgi:hypothetical protein